ncbi:protein RKD1-like [Phoenix dactylifera]|uniref:Protein RKD1-like n=1 Tax=Phoenix dactylifera TaxID=42345 RepID=A0A8B8J1S0_PHODC|nr:protein RKD1-like [Phoenix dactylifera]
MDDEQLENWQLGHDGVGFGEEQPDHSFIGEEVLDAAPLMQSYPSEPFFPSQDLFQDAPFSVFDGENGFWDDMKCGTENKEKALVCDGEKRGQKKMRKGERSREEKALTFEEVSRCFYMPITQAAKELNVGVTLLKRKCRKLGIPRWPHRKLKSLQTLIKNVKEHGGEEGDVGDAQLVTSATAILEQERKLMEKEPAMQLEEKTKRLRQACFKANYKKRRLAALEESQESASPDYIFLQKAMMSTCLH